MREHKKNLYRLAFLIYLIFEEAMSDEIRWQLLDASRALLAEIRSLQTAIVAAIDNQRYVRQLSRADEDVLAVSLSVAAEAVGAMTFSQCLVSGNVKGWYRKALMARDDPEKAFTLTTISVR